MALKVANAGRDYFRLVGFAFLDVYIGQQSFHRDSVWNLVGYKNQFRLLSHLHCDLGRNKFISLRMNCYYRNLRFSVTACNGWGSPQPY